MIVSTQCEIVWMVDFLSNLTTIVGLIGSFVLIMAESPLAMCTGLGGGSRSERGIYEALVFIHPV
jgi:hypothetical protein